MACLLIFTQPVQWIISVLPKVLKKASSHADKRLYIHLDHQALKRTSEAFLPLAHRSHLLSSIYSLSPTICPGLDIRVLLNSFKHSTDYPIHTKQNLAKILIDYVPSSLEFAALEKRYSGLINSQNSYVLFDELTDDLEVKETIKPQKDSGQQNEGCYQHVVVGGTFDRIHIGHKILLSEALIRTTKKLTIGVSNGPLLKRKVLKELILPLSDRIQYLRDFLSDVDSLVELDIVRIDDPMGPAAHDPTMNLIIVSEETQKGAQIINEYRKKNGLNELESFSIQLFEDFSSQEHCEKKFSSSSERMKLLGTRINEVPPNPNIPAHPYIIGLTGGSASGKTNISGNLQEMGAGIIDCDKLGHRAYEYGTPCYFKLVDIFGKSIVFENKQINRKALGAIVFNNKEKLKLLTDAVWPQIASFVDEEIKVHIKNGRKIVVLDAAVLLEAKWDRFCHEVWVCIISPEESVRRIVERDNLSPEEAVRRIENQFSNEERVAKAHIVFCSMWSYEFTRKQVERAWEVLREEAKVD